MKKDLFDYTLEDLREYFVCHNLPRFGAQQVFNWIYKKRIEEFDQMTNLSKGNKNLLKGEFSLAPLKILKKESSSDGTQKFLFLLSDGSKIETVLIPESSRLTLCVSSQVGCKFNCRFCLSGQYGFKRNLNSAEIIRQYLTVEGVLSREITNIVFMGIGEPLDNFTNAVKAIKILREPLGLNFTKRRICVSTCGLIPEIKGLGRLKLGIKLSISLHSANNAQRSKIMPINKKYPLSELINAAREFAKYEKYPVTFEYALISEINSKPKDALELARLLKHINCKVNLIPYNCSCLGFKAAGPREIKIFSEILKKAGIFFTLRKSRGQDISAACGQLQAAWV